MVEIDSLKVAAVGAGGIVSIETVPDLLQSIGAVSPVVQTLVQILLGVVTLYQLIRTKKK